MKLILAILIVLSVTAQADIYYRAYVYKDYMGVTHYGESDRLENLQDEKKFLKKIALELEKQYKEEMVKYLEYKKKNDKASKPLKPRVTFLVGGKKYRHLREDIIEYKATLEKLRKKMEPINDEIKKNYIDGSLKLID